MALRFGIGLTLIIANLVGGVFLLLIPLAGMFPASAMPLLGIAQCLSQTMGSVFYIHQTSLRQLITPEHLLGRMNASYRFLTMGTLPLGSLLGGGLASLFGVRATLLVGTIGMLLAVVWLLSSPVRAFSTHDMREHRDSHANA